MHVPIAAHLAFDVREFFDLITYCMKGDDATVRGIDPATMLGSRTEVPSFSSLAEDEIIPCSLGLYARLWYVIPGVQFTLRPSWFVKLPGISSRRYFLFTVG
jgi:hypothetical protein